MLLAQTVFLAASLALAITGKRMADRMAMIVMTTSSSTSVNARRRIDLIAVGRSQDDDTPWVLKRSYATGCQGCRTSYCDCESFVDSGPVNVYFDVAVLRKTIDRWPAASVQVVLQLEPLVLRMVILSFVKN
jgi:hypothetical protein